MEQLRGVVYSLKQVFTKLSYISLALGVALGFWLLGVWLPIRSALNFFTPKSLPLAQSLAWKLYYAPELIGLNTARSALVFLSLIALLAGINLAVTVFYFRERMRVAKSSGLTVIGLFSGIVGIGCAACGSVIISSLIGFSSAMAILGFLPGKGLEFTIGAIGLLVMAIIITAHKIATPAGCHVHSLKNRYPVK